MDPHVTTLRQDASFEKGAQEHGGSRKQWLSSARAALVQSLSHGTVFAPVIAVSLWILTHPYPGIVGDASVYIGRALADLDPGGLGRDLLFAHDGQSRFSLYPWLVKRLVVGFGTDAAARTLAIASMGLWIAALAALARGFVAWRRVPIVIAFVAVLPVLYGAPQRFGFSEVIAVPRPVAEALVILALAQFAQRRTYLTFVCLCAASLVHPLMALAGWTAIGLALGFEDKRWWIAAALAATVLGFAALLGVPVLDRLVVPLSADLKTLATSRSPLLFPTLWPKEFLGPIIAQATAIAIAASLIQGRPRRLLLAALLTGIFGIAAQALFGDLLSSLLVIQAQVWRMAWLTAVGGSVAVAICTLELWSRGGSARIALAFLSMTWLAAEEPLSAGLFAFATLVLHFGKDRFAWPASPLAVRMVWGMTCLWAALVNAAYLAGYIQFVVQIPAGAAASYSFFWSKRAIAFPICAAVFALMVEQRFSRRYGIGRGAAALVLAVTAIHFWDDRPPIQRVIDAGEHPAGLMQSIADRPGEVLWIGGLQEAWFLTGRPQWGSPQQGVANIFSPRLALAWRDRMSFLRDEGLADRNVLSSLSVPSSAELAHLSESGLEHLCARADAPAYVIAPREEATPPLTRPGRVWQLPQPLYRMSDEGAGYLWHRADDLLILACAKR